jgi:tetratricopeptide (TPR) repeat protein
MRFLAAILFLGGVISGGQAAPDRLRSLVERAQAAEKQDRVDEVIPLYEEILKLRPGWAPAELNLGLAYHARGIYHKAIPMLTNALRHDAGLQSALLFRGASYFHTGRFDDAVADLTAYLRQEAENTEALSLLANAHTARGDVAPAALAYAKLASLSRDPAHYFQLSQSYLQLAREGVAQLSGEEARPYRLRIAEEEQSGAAQRCEVAGDAELTAARCGADRGEFERPTSLLMAVSARPKVSPEEIYWSVGTYQRLARAAIAKLFAVAPDSAWAGLIRAQAAEQNGDLDGALKEYERAVASRGVGMETYVQYGQFQAKHSRYDQALALYEKALIYEPGNPRVGGLIGEIHALEDRPEKAVPFLEKALRANPRETQTRLYLAQALVRLNRTAEALRILESAPEDPDGRLHYLLARTYQQAGDAAKAKAAMEVFRKRRGPASP